MENQKMTIRQLAMAAQDPVLLRSRSGYGDNPVVELTDYMRSFDGVMGLAVFALAHDGHSFVAEVDLPPAAIAALREHPDE